MFIMCFDCYLYVFIFDNWIKINDKNIYFKIEKRKLWCN